MSARAHSPLRLLPAAALLGAAAGVFAGEPATLPVARAALADGRLDDAIAAASQLRRAAPDDLDVLEVLGEAQLRKGALDDAERSIQWMLDLRPSHAPGLLLAARFRHATGDDEGALELLRDVLARAGANEPLKARALALAAETKPGLVSGGGRRAGGRLGR